MSGWSDLTVDAQKVKGLAETLFTDRQKGAFDPSQAIDETDEAAKGALEDVLLHPKHGGLAEHVDDAGGPQKLLDALANDTQLNKRLHRGHALAVVATHASDDAVISSGRTSERSNEARERLQEWAQSFGQIAPYQLGYTSTSSSSPGGAFASTMDAYD